MTKFAPRPESLPYGIAVANQAAAELQADTLAIANGEQPPIAVETKAGDGTKSETPVTALDEKTNELIVDAWQGTDVRVLGEEGDGEWPEDKTPSLTIHADPIDGTKNFIEYLQTLTAWMQLPEHERPPRPVSGASISLGAVDSVGDVRWGVVSMPFVSPDGPVVYTAVQGGSANRIEPDGSRHILPSAKHRPLKGIGLVLMSPSSEEHFGPALRHEGFDTAVYDAGVATALCVMDPDLFERLCPDVLQGREVVASIMRNGENWDVAGAAAVAGCTGVWLRNLQGGRRTYERGNRGSVFALNRQIGGTVMRAIQQSGGA